MLAAVFASVFLFAACPSQPPPAPDQVEEESPPPPPPPEVPPPPPEPAPILPLGIDVRLSPQPFSPDGDGIDDELVIEISVSGTVPVAAWAILVQEPVFPHLPFYMRAGTGPVPARMTWNGVGIHGETAQSAMSYPIVITVTNADGEVAVFEGHVLVDVLVREEGGVLRIIVPAIVFGPNAGDFSGVAPEVMANNERVLQRIAEILQRFGEYSILIEGHANPVAPPGTALREEEELGSPRILGLQPLSEERAMTVLEHLVGLGVDRQRLFAVGRGGTRVLVAFEDTDYWWQNRRVEFVLER